MADSVRCDQCSAHADRPGQFRQDGRKLLPSGWLWLLASESSGVDMAASIASVEGEFCSWPCAAAWLSDVALLRGGDPQAVS